MCATLSISSPDSLRRFSRVKSPMTSPLSPQHMSITKKPLSSKALIWWSVNMASALYFTSLLCCTREGGNEGGGGLKQNRFEWVLCDYKAQQFGESSHGTKYSGWCVASSSKKKKKISFHSGSCSSCLNAPHQCVCWPGGRRCRSEAPTSCICGNSFLGFCTAWTSAGPAWWAAQRKRCSSPTWLRRNDARFLNYILSTFFFLHTPHSKHSDIQPALAELCVIYIY